MHSVKGLGHNNIELLIPTTIFPKQLSIYHTHVTVSLMHTLQGIAVYLVKLLGCTNINLLILATIFLRKLPIYLQCHPQCVCTAGHCGVPGQTAWPHQPRAAHPGQSLPEPTAHLPACHQQCVCTAGHCSVLGEDAGPQQHRAADPRHHLPGKVLLPVCSPISNVYAQQDTLVYSW